MSKISAFVVFVCIKSSSARESNAKIARDPLCILIPHRINIFRPSNDGKNSRHPFSSIVWLKLKSCSLFADLLNSSNETIETSQKGGSSR